MVRRVFQVMYREIRGLHEAAYILAAFALGSQILALVRERLLAHQFGAGVTTDMYVAAFRIPDLLFAIFVSILSVYVLIPYVADRMGEGIKEARVVLSTVFTWFLVSYGVIALVIALSAHYIVPFFFRGFNADEQATLILLMRILLLQPFLLSLSSLLGVVTQLHRKFILYAVSPLLYNFGIIFGIIVLYPLMGPSGLAVGVVIGAAFHLLIQVPFVYQSGLLPKVVRHSDRALVWRILRNSLPRAVTLTLQQFVLLALTAVATMMATGSVSVLQYAYNLQSVPLAIIGVSYSVAAFPTFARLFSAGDREQFLSHVYAALRHIIFWSTPAVALFMVLRAQIVRVILGSGAFDWRDTRLTAAVLALFVISLVAQSVHNLIVRAFYAGGNTRTPLLVTTLSSASIISAAAVFYVWYQQFPSFVHVLTVLFRVEDVAGTEVLTLPLAFSLVFLAHSIVLTYLFIREYGTEGVGTVWRVIWQSASASAVIAAVSYASLNVLVEGFRTETFVGVFLQGFVAGVIGISAGVAFLWAAKSKELSEVRIALHHRLWKSRPIILPEKG